MGHSERSKAESKNPVALLKVTSRDSSTSLGMTKRCRRRPVAAAILRSATRPALRTAKRLHYLGDASKAAWYSGFLW